jgi:hypothetical protein
VFGKHGLIFLGAAVLFGVFFSPGRGESRAQVAFLGWRECATCHEDIARSWQKTRHARAFESLKKTSQEGLPACLKCHVTAYDEPGGFVDFELTPELVGVQCEECHGSGNTHAAESGNKEKIAAKPGEGKCKRCHTPGQDPGFQYGKKGKLVHPRKGNPE